MPPVCRILLKSLSVTGHFLVNMSIPTPEKETVQMGHKTDNGNFLQNYWNDFHYTLVVCGVHLPE
jgi:hypothetical protein